MANQGTFSGKRPTCYLNLVVAVVLVAASVMYYVNATAASNFNSMVVVYLVCGAACAVVFALVDNKYCDALNLVAVAPVAAALAQLIINSINTFADVFSGITMFGSSGGVEWIFTLAAIIGAALVAEVVSCFMKR